MSEDYRTMPLASLVERAIESLDEKIRGLDRARVKSQRRRVAIGNERAKLVRWQLEKPHTKASCSAAKELCLQILCPPQKKSRMRSR